MITRSYIAFVSSSAYHYSVTLLLIPVFLVQALWTRLTIIKLPEPSGKRSGHCGNGEQLKLLIIGDSAAAGVGVNKQVDALSGQLSSKLALNYVVDWRLIAQTGFTAADALAGLNVLPKQTFDVVLLSVGVNDVTHLTSNKAWLNSLSALSELLTDKFSVNKIIFSSIPPMHLFSGLPQPLRWWLGKRAKRLNQLMELAANDSPNRSVLTVDIPFSAKYLAQDNFHPSQYAYQLWAEQAKKAICKSAEESQ